MGCAASTQPAPSGSNAAGSSAAAGKPVSNKAEVDESGKPSAIPTDAVSALEPAADEDQAEDWQSPAQKSKEKADDPALTAEENAEMKSFLALIDDFSGKADFDSNFKEAMAAAEQVYIAYCQLPAKVKASSKVRDASWEVSMPLGGAFMSRLEIRVDTPEEEKDRLMLDFIKEYPWYGRCSGLSRSIPKRQRARGVAHEPYNRLPLQKWDGTVDYDQQGLQSSIAERFQQTQGVKQALFGRRADWEHPDTVYFDDGPGIVDFVNETLRGQGSARYVDPFSQAAGKGQGEGWGFPQAFESMRVFSDDIDPNDIMQGFIGNCWMISTIATVAAWPQLLRDSFYPKTASASGCYAVRVAAKPSEDASQVRWTWIIVDSLFPIEGTGKTACANSRDHKELWPMLLEKALAKMHGSYANMVGGGEGKPIGYAGLLSALTGGLSYYTRIGQGAKEFSSPEKLANYLRWMKMKGQRLLVASCSANPAEKEKLGLVGNHAYSLLGIYTIPSTDIHLVEVRNPWGWFEWKGRWGNTDHENWMKDDRHCQLARFRDLFDWEQIRQTNGEKGMPKDGQFYIEINDFFKYFGNLTTNKVPFAFDVGCGFKE